LAASLGITNTVKTIELCNEKLRIQMHVEMTNVEVDGIRQESYHGSILCFIVGGWTDANTTLMKECMRRSISPSNRCKV